MWFIRLLVGYWLVFLGLFLGIPLYSLDERGTNVAEQYRS
jgi:hypothetical protein